jgi:hypothetical protein
MGAPWDAIFVNENSGLVLDVRGGVFDDHTAVQQYNFHGLKNQRWRLWPTDYKEDSYWIFPAIFYRDPKDVPGGPCLDVAGASKGNGAVAQIFEFHGGLNQHFALDEQGPSLYRIRPLHSEKCLDVADASQAQGAVVHQWDFGHGSNQIWRWVHPGDLESQ